MGTPAMKIAGTSLPHESARGHVTGDALYVDDLCGRFSHLLHAWPVLAPHAHALVTQLDPSSALEVPGVVTVLTEADVPGEGNSGANRHDEPLFPNEVFFYHQPIAWVLGDTLEAARLGAQKVSATFEAAARHPDHRASHRRRQLSQRAAENCRWRHFTHRIECAPRRRRAEDWRSGAFLSRNAGGARLA